jgi:hypothetical protein
MILLIGEWPYYRRDYTRLRVTLILKIFEAGAAHRAVPVALDIVESRLNVNGKKFPGSCEPSVDSKQIQLPVLHDG